MAYILRLPGLLSDGASGPWLIWQIRKMIQGEATRIYNADTPFNHVVWVGGLCRFVYERLKSFSHSANFRSGRYRDDRYFRIDGLDDSEHWLHKQNQKR